jgi:hypothetical protein
MIFKIFEVIDHIFFVGSGPVDQSHAGAEKIPI